MNFHVASRGIAINFDFPAGGGGGGGHVLIIKKNFIARFVRSCFIN